MDLFNNPYIKLKFVSKFNTVLTNLLKKKLLLPKENYLLVLHILQNHYLIFGDFLLNLKLSKSNQRLHYFKLKLI